MRAAEWLAGLLCQLALLVARCWEVRLHPRQEALVKTLASYEVVTPARVDEFGAAFPESRHFSRRKRSPGAPELALVPTFYRISAYGQLFQLNLSADAAFLAAGYTEVHLGGPAHGAHEPGAPPPDLRHCFYRGQVNARPELKAVFSLCGGLMGTFKAHDGEYFLEPLLPLDGGEPEDTHNKPHLIYRREATRAPAPSHRACGVSESQIKKAALSFHKHSDMNEGLNIQDIVVEYPSKNSSLEGGKSQAHSRRKRFLSYPRYVEVMVTADARMARQHGQHLQHYVLTLMSIVAAIYRDSSIGNLVNIVVVKIIVIHNEHEGPLISSNAASTLQNFCSWQQTQNVLDDAHPSHHDTAVLITREDICGAKEKCDTLGLAELGTLCDPARSCSVSEDNGLSAAFTIAHELGHVFNVPHDDSFKCKEVGIKHPYHVMAPTLNYQTSPWTWSKCSQKYLTEFLDTGHGECLLDKPSGRAYSLLSQPPGLLYDVNQQCELMFGPGSQVCPYLRQCRRLWCTGTEGVDGGCRTQHMPLADGTACGPGMHCHRGLCVNREMEQRPVDGGWGPWGPYSACSRTCGGGVRIASRLCNHPEPRNGGKYCVGRKMRFRSCNTDSCPKGKEDFREKQCSDFDGKHININGLSPNVRWLPKYSGVAMKDRCKLYCRVAGTTSFYQLRDKVADGTPCGVETSDICVQGTCRQAGCDHVLNSKTKRDKCGVCGGDNSSCRTISGVFNNARYGYNDIVKIPMGATNVEILQHSHSGAAEDDNYLALSDVQGNFLLNGNFVVTMAKTEINVEGTVFEYSGSNNPTERLNSTDRLGQELVLQVLCVGNLYNPDVRYSFNVPVEEKSEVFVWDSYGPWQDCSRMCQGVHRRKVACLRKSDRVVVPDQRCDHLPLPQVVTERCNTDCELRWHVVGKSQCSSRCGLGVRSLDVRCMKYSVHKGQTVPVEDHHCGDLPKPPVRELCHGDCVSVRWRYSEWSQCSRSCGGGERTRESVCVDTAGHRLADRACRDLPRTTSERCAEVSCPRWATSEWSECSATCGHGSQRRAVKCISELLGTVLEERECPGTSRPHDLQECVVSPCPVIPPPWATPVPTVPLGKGAQWRHGSWTPCSASCGRGTQARYVSCRDAHDQAADDAFCAHLPRPSETAACLSPCGEWRAGNWSPCSVSCGRGQATRQVVCVSYHQPTDESHCDPKARPTGERECIVAACPPTHSHGQPRLPPDGSFPQSHNLADHQNQGVPPTAGGDQWRTGPWGSCSSSCAGGLQHRVVVCQDEDGQSASSCNAATKPPESRHCDSGPCPRWTHGSWGECTQTCGGGMKSRLVICQFPNGQIAPEHTCELLDKPAGTAQCHTHTCPDHASWRRGPWESCSSSCGKGIKQRSVLCVHQFQGAVGEQYCSNLPKPRTHKACRSARCPSWKATRWKECSVTCGPGVQHREVFCRLRGVGPVAAERCDPASRPYSQQPCWHSDCVQHQWTAGEWPDCSASCRKAEIYRRVQCTDALGVPVGDSLCDPASRPLSVQKCRNPLCKYIVLTGDSSQCADNCGFSSPQQIAYCTGVPSARKHTPQRPQPVVYRECPLLASPQAYNCIAKKCLNAATWKVGKWSKCSVTCGTGTVRRRVECMTEDGWPSDLCLKHLRPEAQKKCYASDCQSLSTCKEVQTNTHVTEDGDYFLTIEGRLIKIHCAGMRSGNPKEYLPLVRGEQDNFSEVYGPRLQNPYECPFNGSRREDCECQHDYLAAGYTVFSKIRIDLTSMQIKTTDLLFARTIFGKPVPLATAGDCYSAARCPQGQFSINLAGTGMRISSTAKWLAQGNYASVVIRRSQDGTKVYGRCGGFCGKCAPHVATGLPVQVL
ncbi:A disintegrin and metalloproteinase with thrombospondin motifs 20 isoform X2 [Ochotona princeps]|uniref:A disintegrin and metalloproteinase with thrombospondin motifs 20 isoform X2 n=1 Tax=Ochotona princeps TaxID=9978 RepID=UPI002714C37C|nr:A disintegrin and metalloproteinase with thrombospondin motifs 20 isoform X2 [Ochotona princeps]